MGTQKYFFFTVVELHSKSTCLHVKSPVRLPNWKQIWGFSTDFCKRSKYTIALKPSNGSSAGVWGWKDSRTNRHVKANGRFSLFLRRHLKRLLKPVLVAGLLPLQNDWKTIYRPQHYSRYILGKACSEETTLHILLCVTSGFSQIGTTVSG